MPRFLFGPAGKPIGFKGDLIASLTYLRELGLNAMEYEAVRGVRINKERAVKLREAAEENGIKLSLHAPYFINLSSPEEHKVAKSIERLNRSVEAAHWMGAYIVVFHPGYYKGLSSPQEALEKAIEALRTVAKYRASIGAEDVILGPETTGKTTQLGTLDENIAMCREIGGCRPVVDWAHMYARSMGEYITSVDHVIEVVEKIEKELGTESVKPLHMHFSHIEYGKGGERMHHTLAEKEYGPSFEIVCRGLAETGVSGVFISESPILEKDALVMKDVCRRICGERCVAD